MSSDRTFFGVSAVLFAVSARLTIVWCASMQTMGGMPMPGGWTMSMMWMRMPGQSWPGSAASFLGMWTAMMVAMMLPSLVPALLRVRARIAVARRGPLTVAASAGYFVVWTMAGGAVFAAGVPLAAIEMRWPAVSRAVPLAGVVIVLIAVSLQFTAWKAHQLLRCCAGHGEIPGTASGAFRHGIRLGLRCVVCCANWTAILLVIGMMDLRAMAIVTVAITTERLPSFRERTEQRQTST